MEEITLLKRDVSDEVLKKVYPELERLRRYVVFVVTECTSGRLANVAYDTDEYEERNTMVSKAIFMLRDMRLCTRKLSKELRKHFRERIKNAIGTLRLLEL